MSKPKVTVVTITYNHEQFIEDALESFIAQETDFDFEVIVADDASNDKTQQIIQEYAHKFPAIVRPILRSKNIGPQRNFADALNAATGTYLALCEGDDYWTDTQKLQKQVDMLDANKELTVCFHPVKVLTEHKKGFTIFPEVENESEFTVEKLLHRNFIQTNSVMYRRLDHYRDFPTDIIPCDWYTHLLHAKQGKIGFIRDVMSVYRRHVNGMWWGTDSNVPDHFWMKHGVAHMMMYARILELYGANAQDKAIIIQNADVMLRRLVKVDETNQTDLVLQTMRKCLDLMNAIVITYAKSLTGLEEWRTGAEKHIIQLDAALDRSQQEYERYVTTLQLIKSSRAWKLRNIFAKILGKPVI